MVDDRNLSELNHASSAYLVHRELHERPQQVPAVPNSPGGGNLGEDTPELRRQRPVSHWEQCPLL